MANNDRDLKRNGSGCPDPTAYEAIKNIDEETARFQRLLNTIFYICEIAGFHVEERIVIRDKRTGRIWR